jgi:hypothetical protein
MIENIEGTISIFWKKKLRILSDKEKKKLVEILKDLKANKFVDPTSDTQVSAEQFVQWLDPTPLMKVVKKTYPYYDYICGRIPPRIRFFVYYVLSRSSTVLHAYRSLDEKGFKALVFNDVPTYELLREFIYERIGIEKLQQMFDAIIYEIVSEKRGILLGRRCAEDATDIRNLKFDKDVKYNGYYKEYGYKLDVVIDHDNETLPLHYILH